MKIPEGYYWSISISRSKCWVAVVVTHYKRGTRRNCRKRSPCNFSQGYHLPKNWPIVFSHVGTCFTTRLIGRAGTLAKSILSRFLVAWGSSKIGNLSRQSPLSPPHRLSRASTAVAVTTINNRSNCKGRCSDMHIGTWLTGLARKVSRVSWII